MIDPKLKDWATVRQAEFIDAINAHGSIRKAAKSLGLNKETLRIALERAKRSAALRGYAPEHDMTRTVPEPFLVRGVSTYYDENGNAKGQWVKTRVEEARLLEAIKETVADLIQSVPKQRPIPLEQPACSDALATLYTITDAHIGMKAWHAETGADWDLDIASDVLTSAMLHLVSNAPSAEVGIINFLGDLMHFDSLDAVTPQHRNLLDADSRYPKVVSVAVRILRTAINYALQRHAKVIVSVQEGNHDLASTVWLRHLFALLYENEPRVEVIDTVTPYGAIQHGETMLCFHHGHLTKNDSLPLLFAASYPEMWGSTKRRYCHTGHRHHAEEKEHAGMTVIQHQTIAARDAYAARGGWIADRAMTAITYHKTYGQVARATVTPEMLEAA